MECRDTSRDPRVSSSNVGSPEFAAYASSLLNRSIMRNGLQFAQGVPKVVPTRMDFESTQIIT